MRQPKAAQTTSAEAIRILMVTHVIPFPPAAGNEIRILNMLNWMRRQRYQVTLIICPLDGNIPDDATTALRDLVHELHVFDRHSVQAHGLHSVTIPLDSDCCDDRLSTIQDNFCPGWLITEIGRLTEAITPHIVVAQYVFMSRILRMPEHARCLKVIDTHDLFCRKQHTAEQYGMKYGLSLSDEQESRLLQRADVLLAIQATEQAELHKLAPSSQILLVGFDQELPTVDRTRQKKDLVLIVASSNEFNVRGTQDFLDLTWPLVREARPDAKLRILGRVCGRVRSTDPSVELVGYVEDLQNEYDEATVVVNPCRVGTGLKIKTVEALARGKAHVAWPSSIDGLREIGDVPVAIARNIVDFADSVARLLDEARERDILETSSRRFIAENFGPEKVYSGLAAAIEEHLESSTESRSIVGT
ncbi:glycosyltransferase [Rhodopseudomonas sp. WA056]|uniref:glycosyltransferase family 4 protein n=1 Tax=Rhodopseudomonas sp. WA056 TaxID=2269367 RepID=UPI0013E01470|nr:glycosyltransferase family 4 protein [Rhodopseudomonas sp. WA056]NEW89229.1 glycosyltransferase [Rhodopseudomonas sp. WA056]